MDSAVDRRDDLRAVAPVDFVAVVGLRVVRGSHHHTAHAALFRDGVRDKRGRDQLREHVDFIALGEKYLCSDLGVFVGVVTVVVPDYYASSFQVFRLLVLMILRDVGTPALGGLANDKLVHVSKAGVHFGTKPSSPF